MNMIAKFFTSKTTITSDTIRARLADAETEIAAHRAKIGSAFAGVAAMSDAEHVKIEGEIAATERAITRLESLVVYLNAELPTVIATEEAAAKTAADEALRQRAEAARRAVNKESATLLREYDSLAAKIGDILFRLEEIASEANSVNAALRLNPVAESVLGYDTVHRKHPEREASEQREVRPVWRYPSGTVIPAVEDGAGGYKKAEPLWVHHEQRYEVPVLAQEEIVVSRTSFRPGHFEADLTSITLPAGFSGGPAHWPRKS